MAIAEVVEPIETALWPQGDIRDPLGIWGCRLGVTGDASGGSIKVTVQVGADKAGKYIYTCYAATPVQLAGTTTAGQDIKFRLLTSWPNVDPIPGVQAFASWRAVPAIVDLGWTAPIQGPASFNLVSEIDRFLLLFDPRASGGLTDIAEFEFSGQQDLATYSFEAYGYFWDRSVLNAPGGLRHPGSS